MLFNSMAFAIFLPTVFFLYWICPAKYRFLHLIAVSYFFYACIDAAYALLLFLCTAVSYAAARCLDASQNARMRKIIFGLGIVFLLAPLVLFKYSSGIFTAFDLFPIQFMLPVGISFYTFQTLGYLIDIYRKKYPAERHFGYYCLFASFFPQLLSGPIGRGDKLLPQLRETRSFDPAQASYGLKLMAIGYFKKLVVTTLLAPTVDAVYGEPGSYIGLVFGIATLMFAIQIYCDFSGYTDISIGCAKLFGIELADNFKSPYFSCSIREFWGRWHISLSTWLRDYVYIPLGGSRTGPFRHAGNLMLTFLISGIWHGAGATYLVWGALHGLYQILGNMVEQHKRKREKTERKGMLPLLFRAFPTFLAVCFAWVFFRAESLADAWRILSLTFYGITDFVKYLKTAVICLDMTYGHMVYITIPVLCLALYDYASLKTDVIAHISSQKPWVRYPVYVLFLLAILLFSEKGVSTEFYYFQF